MLSSFPIVFIGFAESYNTELASSLFIWKPLLVYCIFSVEFSERIAELRR